MGIQRLSLVVACLSSVCLCSAIVIEDGSYSLLRESIQAASLTQLQQTLKPLHALLLAAPWLKHRTTAPKPAPEPSGRKKAKKQGAQGQPVKVKRKTDNVLSLEKVLVRDGIKFTGSYLKQSQMTKTEMPEVTFMGRSNVGKSSAINALAGYTKTKLAVVSNTPGRTRLINVFQVGRSFNLVDLPGYGFAKVNEDVKDTWGKTLTTYLKTRENLKLAIVLIDATIEAQPVDAQTLDFLTAESIPFLVVATKGDKLSRASQNETLRVFRERLALDEGQPILFSSKTGLGKKQVWRYITDACNKMPDSD